MHLSGNIIKNVKGVTVPNSGGLKGIDIAALLGITGGNADKALEVLEGIRPEHIRQAQELAENTSVPAPLQKVFPIFISVQR